jgi:hypothetical protein
MYLYINHSNCAIIYATICAKNIPRKLGIPRTISGISLFMWSENKSLYSNSLRSLDQHLTLQHNIFTNFITKLIREIFLN